MGCGASSAEGASNTVEIWDDDEDFEEKKSRRRGRGRNAKGGKDDGKKEDFEFRALSSDPPFGFSGQLAKPTACSDDINTSQPDCSYKLEYVYGYRSQDSRQNVYFNKEGHAVYFTAALGVILDCEANTQKFFGGGEVDCVAKNVSSDTDAHTDDIMAISLNQERDTAVSGQVGPSPAVFTWDACTGEKKLRMKMSKGARGVSAIDFCAAGHYVAAADLSNDHCIWVFDKDGNCCWKEKGDQTEKIQDVSFSKKKGATIFCSVGKRHVYFWDAVAQNGNKRKGIFNGNPMTSFSCSTWDGEDVCYTGGANGRVYKWNYDSRCCEGTVSAHGKNYISALAYCEGSLWSGAKDNKLCQIDPVSMEIKSTIDTESIARSIDVFNGKRLLGMRCGTIKCDDKVVMRSHSDGEVWGMDYCKTTCGPITSGDDNKIICWSEKNRCATKYVDCVTTRTDNAARGGASTLAETADAQQFRAIATNGEWTAVGDNAGGVTVRKCDTLDSADGEIRMCDSTEWIEAMSFSPDGTKLAVGSHDNAIRIYDVANGFACLGKCTGHSSFITALDWSCDGTYIRTNSGDYELLFWKTEDCSQDPDGMSNTVDTEWASNSMKVSWETRGVYPSGVDGTHINGVARSPDGSLIATGDDFGLVSIFRNPARPGVVPKCFRGHSEHVTRVCFNEDGSKLFSIGGYDQTLMQFEKC